LGHDLSGKLRGCLRNAGLEGQVVGAEGYGSEFAKFPESAPEADRVKDRRVSVSVREK
jgi:outer membrane protein OmpA-like peptidoglycan-associated protein